jgi:hypothetical protein
MNEKDLSMLSSLTTALVLLPTRYEQLISDAERFTWSSDAKLALKALREAYLVVDKREPTAKLVVEKLLEDPTSPKKYAARALSWAIQRIN